MYLDANRKADIRHFCSGGIQRGAEGIPLLGCGNEDLVIGVVEGVLYIIEDPQRAKEAKREWKTVPCLAAYYTALLFQTDRLSWTALCEIIRVASNASLSKATLDDLREKFPIAAARLGIYSNNQNSTVRKVVRDLAKTVIWAQAVSYLRHQKGLFESFQ